MKAQLKTDLKKIFNFYTSLLGTELEDRMTVEMGVGIGRTDIVTWTKIDEEDEIPNYRECVNIYTYHHDSGIIEKAGRIMKLDKMIAEIEDYIKE